MRFTIANKLFFGSLCVIALNAAYFAVISKLGRINAALTLLQLQNDLRNRLLVLKSTQHDREAAALRFEKTAQKEWPVLFHDYSRVASEILDTIRLQCDTIIRADRQLNRGAFPKNQAAPAAVAEQVRSIELLRAVPLPPCSSGCSAFATHSAVSNGVSANRCSSMHSTARPLFWTEKSTRRLQLRADYPTTVSGG